MHGIRCVLATAGSADIVICVLGLLPLPDASPYENACVWDLLQLELMCCAVMCIAHTIDAKLCNL